MFDLANLDPDGPNPADQIPFGKLIGMKLTKASKEEVVGILKVTPDVCNMTGGVLNGGAIMGLADNLGGMGAMLNIPEGKTRTTTSQSNTHFMRSAKPGDVVTGVSTPTHLGRRQSVWTTRLTRGDGKLVAVVTQTQVYI